MSRQRSQPHDAPSDTPHDAAQAPGQTRLILVRHAETEANLNQVWHGDLDAPLTPRGQAQVIATAQRLAKLHTTQPIDVFYVSPLPRAQSTAAAIAAATGLPVLVEAGLREFGLGDWEGRSFRELRELEDLWGRWEADPAFAPPNGESPFSFNLRATQTLKSLADRHPGQTVLAVTHGAFISSVLATWLGAHASEWRAFDPHNCAVSILVREGEGWRGEVVNDISHLPLAARADYEADY
jgi:2,3-bisphosphoglycerate-dependent phosphoglycerate mutase